MGNRTSRPTAYGAVVIFIQRAVVFCLGLMAMGSALAAYTTSKFEPTLQVQGSRLVLNGAGTRYKAIFKVYDIALYTPQKVSTVPELLALRGPKRINFVALREMLSTDLGVAFLRGIANNTSPEIYQKQTASINQLIQVFSGKRKLVEGDTFAIEYIPGKGTTFFIQGVAQVEPMGDAEFFELVLSIWLGSHPVDFKLKEALLGQ